MACSGIIGYLQGAIAERQAETDSDDFITELLQSEHDGEPIGLPVVMGMCALLLIAGIDTTWSSIGSTMWHLATHPDDRRRLVAEPELMPTAIEEFLRAYAPVTMARRLIEDTEYKGCPMKAGERVLMNFPAANRDPEVFVDADKVILDRQQNRHLAFGAGIHRCAGSNLARMELRVAVEEWLAVMPEFEVTDHGGSRGPVVRFVGHAPSRSGCPDGRTRHPPFTRIDVLCQGDRSARALGPSAGGRARRGRRTRGGGWAPAAACGCSSTARSRCARATSW